MKQRQDISVLILTFNEEQHIERCIRSLLPFAKEIFIVDSFSKDRTVEIAESLGAKVYQNKWINYAIQFQWGLDNCPIETEWVMRMDADEYVLPDLAMEINTNLNEQPDDVSGIYVKRRVFFMKQWIRHGSYYPIWLLRIWRYKHGYIEQRWMDEHIKLREGKTIKFEHDLVDENLNNLTWWTEKQNNYTIREAADTLNMIYGYSGYDGVEAKFFGTQEERKRWLKLLYVRLPLFLRPALYFNWRYFIKFGFLDGKKGLIWHFLQAFWYRFLVDAKIYEIYFKAGRDKEKIREFLEKEYKIKF
jgi:glycosyltransferase involved in cell wall biosynthesis